MEEDFELRGLERRTICQLDEEVLNLARGYLLRNIAQCGTLVELYCRMDAQCGQLVDYGHWVLRTGVDLGGTTPIVHVGLP